MKTAKEFLQQYPEIKKKLEQHNLRGEVESIMTKFGIYLTSELLKKLK